MEDAWIHGIRAILPTSPCLRAYTAHFSGLSGRQAVFFSG
ncbi:Uncharacterised protein [Vibrio cholerae]|nr:Uncharacterised protein [Vibrio cholerae]